MTGYRAMPAADELIPVTLADGRLTFIYVSVKNDISFVASDYMGGELRARIRRHLDSIRPQVVFRNRVPLSGVNFAALPGGDVMAAPFIRLLLCLRWPHRHCHLWHRPTCYQSYAFRFFG